MVFQQKSTSTGGKAVLDKLQDLSTQGWDKETLLQDLRDAVIVFLYKTRKKTQTDQTIEASLYSSLQEQSWLVSC